MKKDRNTKKSYNLLADEYKERRIRDRALREVLNNTIAGITPAEWVVLGHIYEKSTTITDLASELEVSLAFITNTANKLEKMHFIHRKPSTTDGRSIMLVFFDYDGNKQYMDGVEKIVKTKLENK